jgi:hypothetical protein
LIRLLLSALAFAVLHVPSGAADKLLNQPPEGFEALFNGKDLDNWRGQIAEDPRDIARITKGMTPPQVQQKQKEADQKTLEHWKAKDGTVYYDGTRRICNIETREHFGDFGEGRFKRSSQASRNATGQVAVQCFRTSCPESRIPANSDTRVLAAATGRRSDPW